MNIDILTLALVISIAAFLLVTIISIEYFMHRSIDGPGWWALGSFFTALSLLFSLARGIPGFDHVGMLANNAAHFGGMLLYQVGALRFFGRRERRSVMWISWGIFVFAAAGIIFILEDDALRRANLSLGLGVVSFLTGRAVIKHKRPSITESANFVAHLFFANSLFWLIRAGFALFDPAGALLTEPVTQIITYIEVFIFGLLATFGFILLVSQRMAVENQESKEISELIFKTSPDAVSLSRLSDGKYIEINGSWSTLFGYTRQEVLGKTSLGLNIWVNAQDRQGFVDLLMQNGACENFEGSFQRKDGSLMTGMVSSRIISLRGEPHLISNTHDISERKQMEIALRESEETYRFMAENSSDIVWHLDKDYRFTYISPADERLRGFPREEVLGNTVWSLLKPEGIAHVREMNAKRLADEARGIKTATITYQLEQKRKDGSWVWTEETVTAHHDASGALVGYHGITRDISERKKNEDALRESELKFRRLVVDMQVGVLLQSAQAEILLSNPKALELLGLTEEQLLGKTSFDPDWNVIHEDGSPFPGETHPVPQAIATRRSVQNVVMGVYRPTSGDRVWISVCAEPVLAEDGTVQQVVVTFIDITERKQAEQALRETNAYLENLLNYANAPIIVWDPTFRITRFNHAFEFLTGRKEAEVLGRSLEMLFPPALAEASMALIRKTLTGERWETVEIAILQRDGSIRTVLWNSATLFDADGHTPRATIAQGQDITERKQAERALLEAHSQLEQRVQERTAELQAANLSLEKAARTKDEFLASMSHELRTPLTGILGLADVLQLPGYGPLTERQQSALGHIRHSGQHLLELINDILDLSRLEVGKFELATALCSLAEISQSCLKAVTEQLEAKQLQASFSTTGEHIQVQADPRRLKQILGNLLSNSIKFTSTGGSLGVEVSTGESSRDCAGQTTQKMAHITIWDTGIGIKEEDLPRLFQSFVQLDARLSREYSGTGLGLALAQRLAQLHGGCITVESEYGRGSRFTLHLPLAD